MTPAPNKYAPLKKETPKLTAEKKAGSDIICEHRPAYELEVLRLMDAAPSCT